MEFIKNSYNSKKKWSASEFRYITLASKIRKVIGEKRNINRNLKLIDLGSGDGYGIQILSKELNLNLNNCYGVDLSKTAISLMAQKDINGLRLDLNTEQFPFDDNIFDIITSIHNLEHIINSEFHLQEIVRVLKPGGILALLIPNLGSIFNILVLSFGFQPFQSEVGLEKTFGYFAMKNLLKKQITYWPANGHVHMYTRKGLLGQLSYYHLSPVTFFGVPYARYGRKTTHQIFKAFEQILSLVFPHLNYEIGVISELTPSNIKNQ